MATEQLRNLKKDMRISYGILKDTIDRAENRKKLYEFHDVAKQEKITSRHDVAK